MALTLAECAARIGARVIYRPCDKCESVPAEEGVIVRAGRHFAFVRFPYATAPQAVPAEALELQDAR